LRAVKRAHCRSRALGNLGEQRRIQSSGNWTRR
jgi:hypothetical protein